MHARRRVHHAHHSALRRLVEAPLHAAAGASLAAAEAVLDGSAQKALALVRPPGHHA